MGSAALVALAFAAVRRHDAARSRGAPTPAVLALPDAGALARRGVGRLAYRITFHDQPVVGARVELYPAPSSPAVACPCSSSVSSDTDDGESLEAVGLLDRACPWCAQRVVAMEALASSPPISRPIAMSRSDPEGRVRFEGLPRSESYDLWVDAADRRPEIATDQVPQLVPEGASPDEETLALENAGQVTLRVVDATGSPIAGAHLLAMARRPWRSLVSDEDGGAFAVPWVEQDHLVYAAWAEGYLPTVVSGEGLEASPESPSEITLSLPHTLRGVVRDEADPVAGAEVVLEHRASGVESRVTADSRGEFTVSNAPGGPYVLSARKDKRQGRLSVTIPEFGDPPELEVQVFAPASLEGAVVDSVTGKPLEAAVRVALDDSEDEGLFHGNALTDAGYFRIGRLDPGFVRVTAMAADYLTAHADVELREGEAGHVDFALDPGQRITGRILDEDDNPISGARIRSRAIDPAASAAATTDDGGAFELAELGPGPVELVVQAAGYQPAAQSVSAPADDAVIHLSAGAVLEGRVEGPAGPVVGAAVLLSSDQPRGPSATQATDAHGSFRMAGLTPGRGRVVVHAGGLAPSDRIPVVVSRNEPTELPIRLEAGATVSGVVVDADGHPLPGATLDATRDRPGGDDFTSPQVTSSGDGSFTLTCLPAGRFLISALLDGFRQEEPTAAPAGGTGVRVVLSRSSRVRGEVIDSRGSPVHEFQVNGQAFESRDGRFELGDVPPWGSPFTVSGDFVSRSVEATIQKGGVTDLGRIEVEEGVGIDGEVRTAEGQGAPGASVTVTLVEGSSGGPGEAVGDSTHILASDLHGRFHLGHLRPGRYRLTAECPLGISDPVEVAGDSRGVELQLSASAQVTGTLSWADGFPVLRGLVDVALGSITRSAEVSGGSFRLTGLPGGVAHIVGVPLSDTNRDRSTAIADVAVTPGETSTVQLVIRN